MISVAEAIKLIDSGNSFSLKTIKCDRTRKTGGSLTYYPSLCFNRTKSKSTSPPTDKAERIARRNKNFTDGTRDVKDLITGNTIKIHIHLMIVFNGQEVIW